jgi:DNA mismatch repair ATPase MutS
VKNHSTILEGFCNELSTIDPFKHNMSKSSECGYLLKCYYNLQNDDTYDSSLRFSIGFNGYIGNMMGVYENINSGKMTFAVFTREDAKETVTFTGQYYPPFKDNNKLVTNDVTLKKNIIITGPNASGKTTLLKSTAINIIITQQLGCGFYKGCQINPYSHIHSYLNIPDTSERDSLFQAESRRCKDILDQVNENGSEARHFCIFDELYSGTNPIEATKAASAFLSYMCKYKNVDFILTTHYTDVCKKNINKNKPENQKKITNFKMNTVEVDGKIEYKFNMSKGISKIEGAIRIFEEMGYPEEIIDSFKVY